MHDKVTFDSKCLAGDADKYCWVPKCFWYCPADVKCIDGDGLLATDDNAQLGMRTSRSSRNFSCGTAGRTLLSPLVTAEDASLNLSEVFTICWRSPCLTFCAVLKWLLMSLFMPCSNSLSLDSRSRHGRQHTDDSEPRWPKPDHLKYKASQQRAEYHVYAAKDISKT